MVFEVKILNIDKENNVINLFLENDEDLYFLSLIIEKDDIIYSWTKRQLKIKKAYGEEKGERIRIYVGITVEKIEFQRFLNTLRILGKVIEAPEFMHIKGSYHTLTIKSGQEIKIIKKSLTIHHLKILKKATMMRFQRFLIVSLDDDECVFAFLRPQGIEIISTIRPSAKNIHEHSLQKRFKNYFKRIMNELRNITTTKQVNKIIFLGPNMLLNWLRKEIPEDVKISKIEKSFIYLSSGGISGIYEFLRKEESKKVLRELRIDYEISIVKEIFNELYRDGKIALGIEEIKHALQRRALKSLIMTDSLFFQSNEQINLMLREYGDKIQDIIIIPEETEHGKKIKALGGIVGLLYYKI